MIYKLSTNLVNIFSGTYETQWEVEDTDNDGMELPTIYDPQAMLKTIAEAYEDQVGYIKDELAIPWIKSIHFPGTTWSPREYNFTTDSLDVNFDIDYRSMVKYLDGLENNGDFHTWLNEKYASSDGFISFTPHTWQELRQNIVSHQNYEDQAVGALITWAGLQHNPRNFEYMGNIEEQVWDNWNGNGYGGLDYWVECGECHAKMEYNMDGEWYCPNTH